ncbi:RagB/SusD family nutrient uptake outer membrane protein [Sphingobacterium multivorum]|uniref:RagB/SusD family nutrient uptake outer membrane protein n=1 Tax=Sphingobacterium multivorum TaxID=28454 RepID=UPI0028A64583|nr:RagB/SusD family nutrient uptake outer membrane protein [Sphingobacterium multivorum]
MKKIHILFTCFCLLSLAAGCGKDFLDMKRSAGQVVPSTVADFKAIISRDIMNSAYCSLSLIGSDEFYVASEQELTAGAGSTPYEKNTYLWADEIFESEQNYPDWNLAYERIMYANLAMDIENISPKATEKEDYEHVRIAARFHRAWNFYQLAQAFCKVYTKETAGTDPGIPIRLDYDVSVKYGRSTLQSVYDQILKDLIEAEGIQLNNDNNIYMPGTLAVQALLARVYLQMGDYEKALDYADKVLKKKSTLVDYNKLSGQISDEFSSYFQRYGKDNPAIIYYSGTGIGGVMWVSRINSAAWLTESFENGDLRNKFYFLKRPDGTRIFIGSYCGEGGTTLFTGLSVEEMLLIRAECAARLGQLETSARDLNTIRGNRFDGKNYTPIENIQKDLLLYMILKERKKELYMRGVRWEDARRLNREGKFPVTFERELEGKTYRLQQGSTKWVWPIPKNEISSNGLQQNER